MELSERMLKVDTRVSILHLKSLPVADLSTPTWLPTGGRGPCLSKRGQSKNVGKFAVFINNNNNNECLYCSLDKNTYPMLQDKKIKSSSKLQ